MGIRVKADSPSAVGVSSSSNAGVSVLATTVSGAALRISSASTAFPAIDVDQDGTQPGLYVKNYSYLSGQADAVVASSTLGNGIFARCTHTSCQNGVWGFTTNPGASCVIGQSSPSVQGYGVVGRSYGAGTAVYGDLQSPASGHAGYFNGRVHVSGILSKGLGSFRIDHPQDPRNKYLSHSFVESPDMKNIYDGIATLDELGEATVALPGYFGALNENFRYQLTPIGGAANVFIKSEILDGRFSIGGGRAGMRVSWQVTGSRKDALAKASPIIVEELKSAEERGRYLNPELFGQDAKPILSPPLSPGARQGDARAPISSQLPPPSMKFDLRSSY